MRPKKQAITIKPDDTAPEVLATAIVKLATAARQLLDSRLTDRAIQVLLRDATGESMATIERVLKGAATLNRYVKPSKEMK